MREASSVSRRFFWVFFSPRETREGIFRFLVQVGKTVIEQFRLRFPVYVESLTRSRCINRVEQQVRREKDRESPRFRSENRRTIILVERKTPANANPLPCGGYPGGIAASRTFSLNEESQ